MESLCAVTYFLTIGGFDILTHEQNGKHFAAGIFKYISDPLMLHIEWDFIEMCS